MPTPLPLPPVPHYLPYPYMPHLPAWWDPPPVHPATITPALPPPSQFCHAFFGRTLPILFTPCLPHYLPCMGPHTTTPPHTHTTPYLPVYCSRIYLHCSRPSFCCSIHHAFTATFPVRLTPDRQPYHMQLHYHCHSCRGLDHMPVTPPLPFHTMPALDMQPTSMCRATAPIPTPYPLYLCLPAAPILPLPAHPQFNYGGHYFCVYTITIAFPLCLEFCTATCSYRYGRLPHYPLLPSPFTFTPTLCTQT